MARSTSRAMVSFNAAVLVILAVIIAASIGGIAVIDVIRGYASGGTHYAKSHLSAVAALRRFAATGAEEDFYRYRHDIYVPIADRIAREILQEPDIDVRNSYPFLIAGKNHPVDVPGIAWLFRHFGHSTLFAPAVEHWKQADELVLRVDALAERLYAIRGGGPEAAVARASIMDEIDDVDSRLGAVEERFAWQLGVAARKVTRLLFVGLAALGLALAALVVGLGIRTHRRLADARQAISEREQRFRDVAKMAADWIWETDSQYRFTYLSDRVEQVLGRPKTDLLGRTRTEMAVVEDAERWRRHLDELAGRQPFQGFEYAFRRPGGGRLQHFRVSGRPVFDPDGTFVGYRGTGTDVTEEVSARREIETKSGLLETTFQSMSQGISVLDSKLRLVAFNERFLQLLGLPRDRLKIGDPLAEIVRYNAEHGEFGAVDVEAKVAQVVAEARRFEPHVFEHVRPDGTVLEIRRQPLPTGGLVTTYTDISELRQASRDLHAAKIAAETANYAKSTFLANMSHELRTPLNAVIGFAELMADQRFGALDPRYAGYARDIRQSGQHLLAVINDILDIARVEAGKVELSIAALPPRDVVESCLRMVRHRAMEANVALQNEVPADAPPLHADLQRLRQIVINLVGNAVKFSDSGCAVTVQYVGTATCRGLRIVDSGIGIPADQLEAVFEPFTQLQNGFSRRYEGTGLGLPLVRSYMALHGGTVALASDAGVGTSVTILFPILSFSEEAPRLRSSRARG